jgi:4-diphosphocytidyl-2-C-methyl-D-erythritol kinase
MVRLLSEAAPAKINLFLRVTGRRSDGYHELDSIFVPISLCDQVKIEIRPAPTRSVMLRCNSAALPTDDRNLAVRAANVFLAEFGVDAEVLIDLHKEIPMGAGLGGGSSDAGAVLRMMAVQCRIHEPIRLAAAAMKLGADVPFFLDPAPARVGGIGERITPLRAIRRLALVIAVPPIEVSTAGVFRELRPDQWSGATPDDDLRAIIEGRITSRVLVNDLAKVATARWPEIAALKNMLENAGAEAALMTGSGGAVFGIFATPKAAARAAEEIRLDAPYARIFNVAIFSSKS